MKRFNFPVRIINDNTLKTEGTYEANRVVVAEDGEIPQLYTKRDAQKILLFFGIILLAFSFTVAWLQGDKNQLKQQIAHYEEAMRRLPDGNI